MIMTARRLRSMGWIATLVVCAALVMVLAFRVNALRSQVHQSQARIIALKQETMYLETEFETRANQQQLKAWNDVEFGYSAPTAAQYLDNERQLAAYAKPIEPGAPAPIRVASADDSVDVAAAFPAMVSPMTGKPAAQPVDAAPAPANAHEAEDTPAAPAKTGRAVAALGLAGLSDRLGTVHHADHAVSANKAAKAKDARVKTAKARDGKSKLASARSTGKASGKPTKSHFASAEAHADAHWGAATGRRTGSTTLIKLALKDAKAVK